MKILVVENDKKHIEAAKQTLTGHEVTIVESFSDAIEAMGGCPRGGVMPAHSFEAVLTDMMLPDRKYETEQHPYGFTIALRAALGGARYVAMATDINHHQGGMSGSLDEIRPGYKHIDWVGSMSLPNLSINGAKTMFIHAPFLDKEDPDNVCDACHGKGVRNYDSGPRVCGCCNGSKMGKKATGMKNWGMILEGLLEN